MNLALWAAKTGLDAQNTRMAVIANNLANTNTTVVADSSGNFTSTWTAPGASGQRTSCVLRWGASRQLQAHVRCCRRPSFWLDGRGPGGSGCRS